MHSGASDSESSQGDLTREGNFPGIGGKDFLAEIRSAVHALLQDRHKRSTMTPAAHFEWAQSLPQVAYEGCLPPLLQSAIQKASTLGPGGLHRWRAGALEFWQGRKRDLAGPWEQVRRGLPLHVQQLVEPGKKNIAPCRDARKHCVAR